MATIARDVMTTDPDCVSHTDTVEEVAMRMRSLLVAFLPVCDEEGYLCGIVGYRDIGAQARSARGEMASVTAASLVEKAPVTIGVDDPVEDVTRMMAEQRVWLLPVVDGQRLVGVIHYDSIAGSHRSRLPSQRVESSPSPPGSRARVTGSAVRLLG
jgi:CBS domain-containing protein